MPMRVAARADHPALAWRRAGLMAVTGRADGSASACPVPLTEAADGALAALRALAPDAPLPASGALLLGERARLLGLERQGTISANGSCRLIVCRDGGVALNLPRGDDWSLLPALFKADAAHWADVARLARTWPVDALVARGRLLGLAIAADRAALTRASPFGSARCAAPRSTDGPPLVIELASLWAGPLAGALLRDCGADVVKVERRTRPDGARGGDPTVFALLNAGKRSVALDFARSEDIAVLRALIRHADIVIEGSRPRAFRQLGIDAAAEAARGATWISITAHGRDGDAADWIGFGDDAGVAGGLSAAMRRSWGEPLFAGDAIADPLTGITAALAGWASWLGGGGRIVDIALASVVAHACALADADDDLAGWQALAVADRAPFYAMRSPRGSVRALGSDTVAVLGGLAVAAPL
ncbi:CoA transferase [uncultured Sphingomonas sp.]|uniref:CoA transferase n=1 Tax=uncultured Sphingomonas sp. TaxID=158754 RepID=UPI00261916BF|nr:CoA transferase [uncultured Sphingomonas sp.]